MRAEVSNF